MRGKEIALSSSTATFTSWTHSSIKKAFLELVVASKVQRPLTQSSTPSFYPKGATRLFSFGIHFIHTTYHGKQHHQGYDMTHRQCSFAVSHFVATCVTCRRLRGHAQGQKMADLPPERVTPAPPFTYTGMDVFGPFYIKEGRKGMKRWGLIFTCLSSRAIHLETLNSMTTDSFLNALRVLTSRRKKVRELRSDQETNFVGAKNELYAALKKLDTAPLKEFLSSQDCDWIDFNLNIPQASHMGGIWERQIRTKRSVLSSLLLVCSLTTKRYVRSWLKLNV